MLRPIPALRCFLLPVALLAIPACKPSQAEEGGGGHDMGAMPAGVVKLEAKTISDSDEYLASLTSRHSITLNPQVSGYVRKIHVKSGDKVREGAVLMTIDPGQQDALRQSLEAQLQTKRAALDYAVQNDTSSQNLEKAGLIGDLDYQQRHSQRLTAEADVKAAEAQVQAQSALLRFYTITAPIDGVVGDLPVKVGDFVDPQTRLTTLDQSALIEAYIYIPIAKANGVTADTTLQLVDDAGRTLCESHPSFISPQVSVDTQTVLVKMICPNDGALRASQVLHARVLWSRHPGVLIPTSAVTRLSGQYFAWVVDRSGKGIVVHQHAIEVGPIQGNEFIVTKGLDPGTEVVVTNIQKIHDGAPITVAAADAPASPAGGH